MQSEPLLSSGFSGWISSALRMARRPATIFQRASVYFVTEGLPLLLPNISCVLVFWLLLQD